MAAKNWVNIGSGNGLLPDGTKPLPEPMLTDNQWGIVAFTWGQFHNKYSRLSILNMSLKITYLKLQPHLPGANELKHILLIDIFSIFHGNRLQIQQLTST